MMQMEREEQGTLNQAQHSKKVKTKAQKYLAESKKHLKLTKGPLHSQFALRITQQNKHRSIINLRNGTNPMNFLTNEIKNNFNMMEED